MKHQKAKPSTLQSSPRQKIFGRPLLVALLLFPLLIVGWSWTLNRLAVWFEPAATSPEPEKIDEHSAIKAAVARIVAFNPGAAEGLPQQTSYGTGFILDSGQTMATARHVLQEAVELRYEFNRESDPQAGTTIVASDRASDLALLAAGFGEQRSGLKLGSSETLRPGQTVLIATFPTDSPEPVLQSSVFLGRVALSEAISWLAFEAEFAPGSSGAPIIDPANRRVVGIVALSETEPSRQRGFAVPAEALAGLREYAGLRPPVSLAAWREEEDRESEWRRTTADPRLAQIRQRLAANNLDGSLRLVNQWLSEGGDRNPSVLLLAADVQERLGNLESARRLTAQAAEIGNYAQAWHELARRSRALGKSNAEESAALLRRAVAASPGNGLLWLALANALAESGDHRSASRAFNRARALQPALNEKIEALNHRPRL